MFDLFGAMLSAVLGQVTLRYFFNHPLVWTDELAQYLFVWISFLGWAMAMRRRVHIAIGVVTERRSATLRRALRVLWSFVTLVFAALLLRVGCTLVRANFDVQMTSLDFGFWWVYLAIPLAAILFGIYAIRDGNDLRRGRDIKITEVQL